MIHWTVTGNKLRSGDDEISTTTIEYLTGKRLDWKLRDNKTVSLSKAKTGRILIHDSEFIPGCTYKKNYRCYICIAVDSKNQAMLTPTTKTTLKAETSNNPLEWELVS